MRFTSLSVSNFRAVAEASLDALPSTIVIAGPNGCGKSALFDALRLLKSYYGGYSRDEVQQWYGEFQIDINRPEFSFPSLFRDPERPIRIAATIVLAPEEKAYIAEDALRILEARYWREAGYRFVGVTPPVLSRDQANTANKVRRQAEANVDQLLEEARESVANAELTIRPDYVAATTPSFLLETLWSVYAPGMLGIIDYHGANRTYAREQIGGINLSIDSGDEERSQHALYNYTNKYANLKTQLASAYVRALLSEAAGGSDESRPTLIATLTDLFETFFPEKTFRGPQPTPDGRLLFPVDTAEGSTHDINDLSSGEKEVLYGYLRLRNSAPQYSVLLLDEPELHLNPRLIRGLPQFYHRTIGRAMGNQLWLVTHSDTLLREALGYDDIGVFHMTPASSVHAGGQQISQLLDDLDIERALFDLVGDLATYRPDAKVVLFEGGGDAEFDLHCVATLFPEFADAVNMIAAGDKNKVRRLHAVLDAAASSGALGRRFFAVVDRDSDAGAPSGSRSYSWDVYHIENYLLDPDALLKVAADLLGRRCLWADSDGVRAALAQAAGKTVDAMVRHEMQTAADRELIRAIRLSLPRTPGSVAPSLGAAVTDAGARVSDAMARSLSTTALADMEVAARERLAGQLSDGSWMQAFRGRDILKEFCREHFPGRRYEDVRNLTLAAMRDRGAQPSGMDAVLSSILDA